MTSITALVLLVIVIIVVVLNSRGRINIHPQQDRVILEWLKAHQTKDPSFLEALLAEKSAFVVPVITAIVGFWFVADDIDPFLGAFFVGLACGIVGARVGQIGARLRVFRTYRSVTDWAKVEQELQKG